MTGPVICILFLADTCASYVHPVINPVAPYGYLFPNIYLLMADISNPGLFVCVCRTWICLDITRFYEETSGPHGRFAQKTVNRVPIAGGGKFRHNLHNILYPL